ncbi:HTH-type transcriptional regulator DegA [Streptomyces sp. RB5]|uniref:HTH-type transcriptional regulator DegA n=1 Tax=Streptomyces smaragdinus TaxID=2585196 RepID=A0A7K0CPY6_9ACTN|nr:LacI family DNA-binding transcriptional regulator [Streptomyces smaragdinus]MQY15509.1 HTH-type transcriptional regulator DegA [Streptomyces smaragdinus]
MAGQITLSRLADQAGVSVSTVSKVLNGRTDVSPATRERITRMLTEAGYRTARPSGLVDLIVGGLNSPWADALVSGAVQAAAEGDCRIVINSVSPHEDFDALLSRIQERGTDGLLTVHRLPGEASRARLEGRGTPFVVIDPPVEPGAGIRSVGATNWQGGLAATRHLIGLGHRRIAAVTGPPDVWCARARLDGYRAALLQAGLPVDDALIRSAPFSPPGGREETLRLLDAGEPPTAIVAGSDGQAFGVLRALAERGLRAPHDISVTGFDDVSVATWSTPPLTTVHQPLEAMTATAFRMLRSSGGAQPEQVELATTLVVRDSTAAPRN